MCTQLCTLKRTHMILANVRELRANLSHYLDLVERGEEITIIRNSAVIGRLVPATDGDPHSDQSNEADNYDLIILNDRRLTFRRLSPYEDPAKIMALHSVKAGGFHELMNPQGNFASLKGEFWVGEHGGELVATGGFKRGDDDQLATVHYLFVKPDYEPYTVGDHLLNIMDKSAKRMGYRSLQH